MLPLHGDPKIAEYSKGNFVKFGDELGNVKQKLRHAACNSSYIRNCASYDHRSY